MINPLTCENNILIKEIFFMCIIILNENKERDYKQELT